MQIALERTLRENLQRLAAEEDTSIKDWILDNIINIHHDIGLEAYLIQKYGSVLILATPANCARYNILIENPEILRLLERMSETYQRSRPQIVYTVITNMVDEHMAKRETPMIPRAKIA